MIICKFIISYQRIPEISLKKSKYVHKVANFVVIAGTQTNFQDPGMVCIGPCKNAANCNQSCISQGFQKGGVCVGFSISDLACCCKRN